MMKFKSFSLIVVFLFASLTTNTSCKDECDTLLLCDLAFAVATIVQPTIAIGAKLALNNIISNLEDECERNKANASTKKTNAWYKENPEDPWTQVYFSDDGGSTTFYDVYVPTNELDPGEYDDRTEEYKFSTEGYYRFSLQADCYDVNNEENEGNNSANSDEGTINSSKFLIVKVVDPTNSGQYKRKKGEPVIVEYLGSRFNGKYKL